jgi:hypothetical protein
MKRPTTDNDVAVYGIIRNSSLFLFIRDNQMVYIHIKLIVNIFIY